MIKRIIILIKLVFFVFNFSFCQDNAKYRELIKAAWSYYKSKEYLSSGEKYSEAFTAAGGNVTINDRYNAACSWALGNQPDSAFIQLFNIVKYDNYSNYRHLTTDTDLNLLHKDERWKKVLEMVKDNQTRARDKLDKSLVTLLDSVYQEDQKYRAQIKIIEAKYGSESDEMTQLWKVIHEKDSINTIKVKKILDNRGWLGSAIIGSQGNSTLFLVIQHSDIETQQKYLPMMREAVMKGNAKASSLALLEDRVSLRKDGKQIYGSQVGRNKETGEYYILPLLDPDKVNERRAKVGLGTIQEYISNWGIIWNVQDYKKKN